MFAEGWARSPLCWLMDAFGAGRLTDLAYEPGLVAAVDQHAAEVRDAITFGRETLSDYLLGFADELRTRGWAPHAGWDFVALRLTAICWLAREHGFLTAGGASA